MANKVILVGRTGAKPQLTFTADQVAVASFSMAITESWKDKETGEKRKKTQWVQCVAWGKKAQALSEYMEKGRMYYVEGKL